MADIVLTTLNSRYIHASFGLRYLLANLGDLSHQAQILEFGIKEHPRDVVEQILARNPRIIGLGIYIWNAGPMLQVVSLLKRVAPQVMLVLGGPEVSYEPDQQLICQLADVVIGGEADLAFAETCRRLLAGDRPPQRFFTAALPDMEQVRLPYSFYDDHDLQHRLIYVEASRGCPFRCEFCLSSLDIPVRRPQPEVFLKEIAALMDRGAKVFKFVDRTFNLNIRDSLAVLEFFLARYEEGMFFHFEMVPDRLPDALKDCIRRFPPGVLQFEVGIQTFNPEVADRIQLRRDYVKTEQNLAWLKKETGVHIHADLILGLPGEDLASFARGFDRLVAVAPHEIQVGILKRLRGTPIIRHDEDFQMRWSAEAPYEILSNRDLDFATMQRLRRFSQLWDRVGNSGNFTGATPLIWGGGSPFFGFMEFCDYVHQHTGRSHSLGLDQLSRVVFEYLSRTMPTAQAGAVLAQDYQRPGRQLPGFLRPYGADQQRQPRPQMAAAARRQARFLGADSA